MTRVAFFADPLYYRIAAGTTRYVGQLVQHLATAEYLDLRLFSFYPEDAIMAAGGDYPPARSIGGLIPRPLQYQLWHAVRWSGPAAAICADADVVHTPALLVPPRRQTPLVVTVHDLAFLLFPQHYGWRLRFTARQGLLRAVQDADALIAVSAHTALDLERLAGVSRSRIHVIPNGVDECFVPVDDPSVPARYGLDGRYVLYVGTLEPRKNLSLLLHAFAMLEDLEIKLVLAGTKGWLYEDIFATVERLGLSSRVVFPGFVPAADLPALITAAEVFVYPSVYEGFGLPVLEAMQCGTPVITTNVSSLPEVAGDAAITVSPDDVNGLSEAIGLLLAEPDLRAELREKGFQQAARFSWRKTAEQTAAVYQAVAR